MNLHEQAQEAKVYLKRNQRRDNTLREIKVGNKHKTLKIVFFILTYLKLMKILLF